MQLRKVGVEPTDDAVLLQLLFPNLAAAYRRGPEKPAKREPAPEVKTEPAKPAPAAEAPAPAAAPDPPAAATTTAEFEVEVEGEVFKVKVTGAGMAVVPMTAGATPASAAPAAPAKPSGNTVMAPMQGLIVKIPIKAGDDVKLGDVVAVLEAMKMQNDIVTTFAGKVRDIFVSEGQVVGPNQPLVAIG